MYEAICVLLFFLQKIIKTHIVIWKDIRISKNIYIQEYDGYQPSHICI
jgi:hypothetical protein